MQYGMQYIHVWYMYCTLYILHMYHMYMQQCVMPLHITYMYDMMYRQYITSHITCVVCYMTYTLNVQQQYTVYSRSIQVLQYSACTYVYMQLCMLYLVPLHMSMVYTIYVVLQVCHVWQCHIHSIGICVYHTVQYSSTSASACYCISMKVHPRRATRLQSQKGGTYEYRLATDVGKSTTLKHHFILWWNLATEYVRLSIRVRYWVCWSAVTNPDTVVLAL